MVEGDLKKVSSLTKYVGCYLFRNGVNGIDVGEISGIISVMTSEGRSCAFLVTNRVVQFSRTGRIRWRNRDIAVQVDDVDVEKDVLSWEDTLDYLRKGGIVKAVLNGELVDDAKDLLAMKLLRDGQIPEELDV